MSLRNSALVVVDPASSRRATRRRTQTGASTSVRRNAPSLSGTTNNPPRQLLLLLRDRVPQPHLPLVVPGTYATSAIKLATGRASARRNRVTQPRLPLAPPVPRATSAIKLVTGRASARRIRRLAAAVEKEEEAVVRATSAGARGIGQGTAVQRDQECRSPKSTNLSRPAQEHRTALAKGVAVQRNSL